MGMEAPHVVVGAGLSGLTAAAELSRGGGSVMVLESGDEAGGMCRSFTMDGVVFDIGPHMLMYNPGSRWGGYLDGMLQELPTLRRRYRYAVFAGGRTWRFPPDPWELLSSPAWAKRDIVRCLIGRAGGRKPDSTLRGHLTSLTGRRHYETVFEPLIATKLGTAGSVLHAHWMTRPHKNVYTSGDMSMKCPVPFRRTPVSAVRMALHEIRPLYSYPEGGMSALVSLLRRRIRGGLRTGCGELRVRTEGRRITGLAFDGGETTASSLVWTAPVADLYRAMGEPAPAGGETVPTRMVFVTFRTENAARRPYLYTYHLEGDTVFHRIYYPRSIFREATPKGIEGLCFEIRLTDGMREMDEGSLADLVASDARRIGAVSGRPLSMRVIDVPHASPLLAADYVDREGELFGIVQRYDNLFLAGRQGNHCNCLMPGAVAQGLLAADRVLGRHAPA